MSGTSFGRFVAAVGRQPFSRLQRLTIMAKMEKDGWAIRGEIGVAVLGVAVLLMAGCTGSGPAGSDADSMG
ncbi:hypothetical protein ACFFNY_09400 [Paenibacillus hodogayensis]|uniref:Uncharacterized protein n=1 Tax=Paenibacillus hodogayensis TaxID=279208 RepID=A0ABV5VU08_9BACL